jgi:hypothetical protein
VLLLVYIATPITHKVKKSINITYEVYEEYEWIYAERLDGVIDFYDKKRTGRTKEFKK